MKCRLAAVLELRPVVAAAAVVTAVLTGACASTGHVPQPFPGAAGNSTHRPARPLPAGAPAIPGTAGYGVVATALELRGSPYRNGGEDPQGFDCSGFTQYVFARHQIALPREVRDQYRTGRTIGLDEVVAGDLMFFSTTAPGASHVAIALGPDEFVHAPSSNGVVRIERLSSSYWSPRYLGARRVIAP